MEVKPDKITIHCTASPDLHRYELEQIRKDHVARGFKDIGYHLVIQPNGEVQKGRPLNETGAHVERYNVGNLGIALVGTRSFTRGQFASLRYHIDSLVMSFSIKPYNIFAHSQFDTAIVQGKTCPNMSINRLLYWYLCNDEAVMNCYLAKSQIPSLPPGPLIP